MSKTSSEVSIAATELSDKGRYYLILRGVQLGLRDIGIDNVSISSPKEKDGRLVFTVERKG